MSSIYETIEKGIKSLRLNARDTKMASRRMSYTVAALIRLPDDGRAVSIFEEWRVLQTELVGLRHRYESLLRRAEAAQERLLDS